ncbi:MAG: NAD(P)-dependent oxidoreductase, partial [Anaerovorax sp.]
MNSLKDKKVLVVGMGKSGIAAMQALLKLEAQVSVNDSKNADDIDSHLIQYLKNKNVTCYFGENPNNMKQFDMIVLSPGVPLNLSFIEEAKALGVEITG